MICTISLKIISAPCACDWQGVIEIESSSTLDAVHAAIQAAVDFEDDHLYEFFISRTPHSRDRVCYDDENEEVYSETLETIFPLKKNRKLFYLFDYGDNWIFQVSLSRKAAFIAKPDVQYPRLIAETGDKPQQYPDWDE